MQKALVQINLQLHVVISDIAGATGLRILRDIVDGQTDPRHLATHRDARCQASEAEIAAALTGHCRAEHLFVLRQTLELYDALQRQIESLRHPDRVPLEGSCRERDATSGTLDGVSLPSESSW